MTRAFLTDAGQPRVFVIVSSARSGSNLLVRYLRQVSAVACFGEILLATFPDEPRWDPFVRRLGMPPEALQFHREDLTAFWDLFLTQGLRQRQWVGAKAFYYHRRDDAIWDRFAADDHRIIHLWRDATFDQYVSRLLAVASGEWKSQDGQDRGDRTFTVAFERDDYLRYRETIRSDIETTRARYGSSNRYFEIEYRQLSDHIFVADLLERLFGERIDVQEALRRQRGRPKLEYLANPADAEAFVNDSIGGGFADQ